ncbi:MAG: hypothetical protein IPP63_13440 [Chloracidobacterium sp.]|nr:hypothetical protein [Chloracidobacterium sp.]
MCDTWFELHSLNGAVNPIAGDVFSSGGNCSAGSSVILATAAGGNASSVSSTFISGTEIITRMGWKTSTPAGDRSRFRCSA